MAQKVWPLYMDSQGLDSLGECRSLDLIPVLNLPSFGLQIFVIRPIRQLSLERPAWSRISQGRNAFPN